MFVIGFRGEFEFGFGLGLVLFFGFVGFEILGFRFYIRFWFCVLVF